MTVVGVIYGSAFTEFHAKKLAPILERVFRGMIPSLSTKLENAAARALRVGLERKGFRVG